MAQQIEPLFGGTARVPPPEVFENARRNNPVWAQVLEEAYAQFATRPEANGRYADPKGAGATVQQMWLFYTTLGVYPYCVLAASLPPSSTEQITHLIQSSPEQLTDALVTLQRVEGNGSTHVGVYDGVSGHAINIESYDEARDRFIYHDPWPERSLLAKENNAAGVDAQPEGTRWSITRGELTRVIFVAFIFPLQWAKIQGQQFDLNYDELARGQFFSHFHLKPAGEHVDGSKTMRLFTPGPFAETIRIVVESVTETEKVTGAALQIRSDWLVRNFAMAIDLAKSFVGEFAPLPDRDRIGQIAEWLWELRHPDALQHAENADTDESEAMEAIHAFMGKTRGTRIDMDFARLAIGIMSVGDAHWHSIEYQLM